MTIEERVEDMITSWEFWAGVVLAFVLYSLR